jgi:hypothetical protein
MQPLLVIVLNYNLARLDFLYAFIFMMDHISLIRNINSINLMIDGFSLTII